MQSPSSKRKRLALSLPDLDTLPTTSAAAPPFDEMDRSDSPHTTMAQHFERLGMDNHHVAKSSPDRSIDQDMEIPETPGACDSVLPSPCRPPGQQRRFILHPPRRMTCPPPPTPVASPLVEDQHPLALPQAIQIAQEKLSYLRCDSPSDPSHPQSPNHTKQTTNEVPPAQAELSNTDTSLTWQESEITGHEIDAAADDDGEGINGVGFVPTAAMANQRSERRRRQILEWRARESKEARQRRYDKRKAPQRDSAIAFDEGGSLKRRMVRFAEA